MPLEGNTKFKNQSLVLLLLLPLFLSQTSCHDDEKENKEDAAKISGMTFEEAIEARRAKARAIAQLSYVDQSEIVSNGKDYGVKILGIKRTAQNYMLDFRFHIFDLEKAKDIMQRKVKALLTVERDGSKLIVPVTYKLGALRQSGNNLIEGKNYFMFFANPGGYVKAGDLVTFELGGFKAEHITVN